jgi:hypothetical protein
MARRECGIGGTGPTSTLNQTGPLAKLVERVQDAWIEIQASRPYWKFLRNKLTLALEIGVGTYTVSHDAGDGGFGLTTVDKWDKQSTWIYETSLADRSPCTWMPYQDFVNKFATQPDGRPSFWTDGPAGTVIFDKTPDVAYTIVFDYWMTPERLVNSNDVPALPAHFHRLIAWKTVEIFGGGELSPEIVSYATKKYDKMFLQLMVDQLELPASRRDHPIANARQEPRTFERR